MLYGNSPDASHLPTLLIVRMAVGGPAALVLELVLIPQYVYGSLGAIPEDERSSPHRRARSLG
jgi:hypothetical protein